MLGFSLAFNYLSNIIYCVIYTKFIKPLVSKHNLTDVVTNFILLAVGTATNYRIGLISFSKMVTKPYIYINLPNKLTPIHYMCVSSTVINILSLAGCGLLMYS